MKILFFIPRMGGGGAERVVANLANEFDKRGNSVVIYTPTESKSFYRLNPNVKILGENYYVSKKKLLRQITLLFNGIRLWFSYKRRIDQEKPDVIERVHINHDARLFGKFCRICRQKSLKYGRIPPVFFLKYGKIMLKNPHISFM